MSRRGILVQGGVFGSLPFPATQAASGDETCWCLHVFAVQVMLDRIMGVS